MISTQSISTHDWDRETADDPRCLHSHAPIKRNTSCICTYVYLYGLYKLGQVAGKAIASSFPAIYHESFSLSFSINFPLSLIFDELFRSPSLIFNKLSALSLSLGVDRVAFRGGLLPQRAFGGSEREKESRTSPVVTRTALPTFETL